MLQVASLLLTPYPRAHVRLQLAPPAVDSGSAGGVVLLSAHGLSQTFDGEKYQFRDISLNLARGAKVGLVGANGVGKSSLLKALSGDEAPEGGEVKLRRGVQWRT